MKPNLQQTYMTPAASKIKVYFMWDFVGRTIGNLYNVDPTLSSELKEWAEVRGRAIFSGMLIAGYVEEALERLTESTYLGQKGRHPDFGNEIRLLALDLMEVKPEDRELAAEAVVKLRAVMT